MTMLPDGEDVVKQAFMEKRSIMKKSLLTNENYRKRWFELTRTFVRYSDGTPEVCLLLSCCPHCIYNDHWWSNHIDLI